ncbi:helicase-associated domain-containing protein [Corynebacterium aquilae]|uniref:Helicase XPB/Ssl2 N-terminal domain-containing protein n=1 Tax=Corynebacterium aquilae DSM 44791 TaxID=1431546 RepID=A0A1L7CEP0_9CORY|nr:helicase-associated domain-containing protein [Corynebacterium aquilae]APT84288.1 hypothetical protein CAQU_03505 [Corynebacterium aquilae DSM 44791]
MTSASLETALADHLRGLSDKELTRILSNRPDVLSPIPAGFPVLASRMVAKSSSVRAVRELSAPALVVFLALEELDASMTPVAPAEISTLIKQRFRSHKQWVLKAAQRDQALKELATAGLAFVTPEGWRAVSATNLVSDALRLLPPPGALASAAEVKAVVDELPEACRRICERLAQASGVGSSKDAAPDADPSRPIPQLISRGVLVAREGMFVELVPAAVRFFQVPRVADIAPVAPEFVELAGVDVDARGAAAAAEAVRLASAVVRLVIKEPIALLKAGDVGVRVAAKVAESLGTDVQTLARLLGWLLAAGVLAKGEPDPLPADDTGGDYVAAAGSAGEDFLALSLPDAWALLIQGWLSSSVVAGKVGVDGVKVLSSDSVLAGYSQSVRTFVEVVAGVPQGCAVGDAVAGVGGVRGLLAFARPVQFHSGHAVVVDSLVGDAEFLGLVVGDAVVGAVRVLAELGCSQEAVEAVAEAAVSLFPEPSSVLLAQGDMTLLAPGPLVPQVVVELSRFAVLESSGLASTWRVDEASLRRGFASGLGESEIVSLLESCVVGEIPQAMRYLIGDVARNQGVLRGGTAVSFLRCDDPALLAEVVSSAGGRAVGLRLLAPTVAVADVPLIQVLSNVQAEGFQPVAEDRDGNVVDVRVDSFRVPQARVKAPAASRPNPLTVGAAVEAIRHADAHPGGVAQSASVSQVVDALGHAVRARKLVTLGFVGKEGVAQFVTVQPVRLSAGTLDALNPQTRQMTRFGVHRITSVVVE